VPSYAELLSASSSSRRTSKAKPTTGAAEKKKKKIESSFSKPPEPPVPANPAAANPAPALAVPASAVPTSAVPEVVAGCRVVLGTSGLFGTVRYVGGTSFQAGEWVGVELDSEAGKNDGTVKGERYFTCPQNYGIFVRPSSFDVISYPSSASSQPAPTPPAAPPVAVRDTSLEYGTSMSVKSAGAGASAVSDSDNESEASIPSARPSYASSYASSVRGSSSGRKSGASSPVNPVYSPPRRSSTDIYGSLFGNGKAEDEPPSPSALRSSTTSVSSDSSVSRFGGSQGRRLSPRRRTSALVSSIDDVLASMEYASSSGSQKGHSSKSLKKSGVARTPARPKSPFERQSYSQVNSYSTEEERLFVENLVELVAKSPVVSEYLSTEIEKRYNLEAATKTEVAALATRVEGLETTSNAKSDSPAALGSMLGSMAKRFESRAETADRQIEALAQRVASLEDSVAGPLKALNEKLGDIEVGLAKLGPPNGPTGQVQSELKAALETVRALALQAHNAVEAVNK